LQPEDEVVWIQAMLGMKNIEMLLPKLLFADQQTLI
jgi:hypothetical protein